MPSDDGFAASDKDFTGQGLSSAEVETQRQRYGPNAIPEKHTGAVVGTLTRMWDPISWLLEAAMVLEIFLGRGLQAFFVFLLLVFSAVTGQVQASRAHKAIGYLQQQLHIRVKVLREGQRRLVPSEDIVPDDVVLLSVGDIVPADIRITHGTLTVNESALTGESAEVTKCVGDVLYAATVVSHGSVSGTVIATGAASSYGKTADLVRRSEPPGRLQKLLFTVVRYLAYLDLCLAAILLATALIRREPWQDLLPFLVILFIATIPISMPSSFTVANSLEAHTLAQRGVLVAGLSGIQEAATMNVLLVDKTGTLTRNQPEVTGIHTWGDVSDSDLIRLAAAATDLNSRDTISSAIATAMRERAIAQKDNKRGTPWKRIAFTAFDPVSKVSRATVVSETTGANIDVVVGSPVVLKTMVTLPTDYAEEIASLATSGARVVAVASGTGGALEVRGLLNFADSPRKGIAETLREVQNRGVRLIMVTGDSRTTAQAIAQQVGIGNRVGGRAEALAHPADFDVLAEVYPQDKHAIARALQEEGYVVGMTGDGINDAPALKQVDVGIAVSSATDAAKAAARVVLTGEGLEGVTALIDSGHRVYRRMMTWTITKLARTAELAALLTCGFIIAGFFPVSLNLIVLIVIVNDLVTLALGTDHATSASLPEQWDMPRLARIAAIFTVGWLAMGLSLFWYYFEIQQLAAGAINSLMFAFLIYSAMATILMTRTRGHWWKSAPSRWVGSVVTANVVLASVLVIGGFLTTAVDLRTVTILLLITLIAMFFLDALKVWFYRTQPSRRV